MSSPHDPYCLRQPLITAGPAWGPVEVRQLLLDIEVNEAADADLPLADDAASPSPRAP